MKSKPLLFIVHKIAPWGIYYSDDNVILDYLKKKFEIKIINWEKTNPQTLGNKVVLIRHPNNYLRKYEKFIKWLIKVEKYAKTVINPPKLVKQNISKRYLLSTDNSIPTRIFKKMSDINKIDSKTIIVKPLRGESGNGVIKVTKDASKKLKPNQNLLLQPFLQGILQGEISTIFINTKYSHSIVKQPKNKNSYKTVWNKYKQWKDDVELISLGHKVLKKYMPTAFYSRLDWIRDKNKWYLSEIEFIDPILYISKLTKKRKMFFLTNFCKMLQSQYE